MFYVPQISREHPKGAITITKAMLHKQPWLSQSAKYGTMTVIKGSHDYYRGLCILKTVVQTNTAKICDAEKHLN